MTAVIPKPAPPKRVRCPRPDKRAFPTHEIAEEKRIEQVSEMLARGWKTHLPTYSYQCPCTFWHWTSRTLRRGWEPIYGPFAGKVPNEVH